MRYIVFFLLIVLTIVILHTSLNESYLTQPQSPQSPEDARSLLHTLHSSLRLSFGTFDDEFPEQMMAVRYLQPDDVVLELGGNIGRNSLIISRLLHDSRQLVTMETDPLIARQLDHNRQQNGLRFQIVCAALSAQRLIQSGWTTEVMGEDGHVPMGYKEVATIDYRSLCEQCLPQTKSSSFTALVADCEGALYYILRDFPELLRTIRTVVMENDYTDRSHKEAVDASLLLNGFRCVYREAGGWGPCEDCFFEVWQKHSSIADR